MEMAHKTKNFRKEETARNWASPKGAERSDSSQMVILLDKHKKPLGFTTERRVRKLFEAHRAVMYRYYPTVVIVKDVDSREIENLPTYRIKIDPGSKYDGIAIIRNDTNEIVWAMQIEHRAEQVKKNLETRKAARRNRRSRETMYRRSKFADGGTFEQKDTSGKLPPSVRSVVGNTQTWIKRLSKWVNIDSASIEAVRFDTQLLDNPDIEGEEYQHGTLEGTEVREYLLDKYQHTCQYCGGKSSDPVLEWEHIVPKSQGGSNKLSNATLSCHACNQAKGGLTPQQWLEQLSAKKHKTELDSARITGIQNVIAHKQTSKSNRYCAWVNTTRKEIERFLFQLFDDVECSSGGRTKFNREQMGFYKDHQYDAACVGTLPEAGLIDRTHGYYVLAKATGRGTRFRGKTNKCGIITKKLGPRAKRVFGFMNGDIVKADVPKGKYAGHWIGRVMTRASGSFDIRTADVLATTNVKNIRMCQYANGYQYQLIRTTSRSNQYVKHA